MKFKIEYKQNKIKGGYIGMNRLASKSHHIPWHHKKENVIEIYSKVPKEVMKNTIKHEEIEYSLMKKGMNYHKAHKNALKYESSKSRVKDILKKIKV